MSATTARIVGLSLMRGTVKVGLRDATFRATDRAGLVQRVLAPLLSQLDTDYGDTGDGLVKLRPQAVHVGQRVPLFAPLPDGSGPQWPALDRDLHTVLAWPGRQAPGDWPATVADLERQFAGAATVLDGATASGDAALALRDLFGDAPVVAVVRPDGHLAHLGELAEADQALRFLQGITPLAAAPMVRPRVPV
ncbi:MAG: hypothetical protein ACJ786_09880, partial [Catenulispora sp.]